MTLVIPANALSANTAITVATATAPSGYTLVSGTYQFGPSGTTFAQPISVTIPLTVSAADAHMFWSNASGGFDDLGGTVSGMSVTANVTHFSIGFCALPVSDGGATGVGGASGANGGAKGSAGGNGGAAGTTSSSAGGNGGAAGATSSAAGAGGGANGGTGGSLPTGWSCASEGDCASGEVCCIVGGVGTCTTVATPKPPYACGSSSATQLCQGTSDYSCYSSGTEGVYYYCKALTGYDAGVPLYECSATQ